MIGTDEEKNRKIVILRTRPENLTEKELKN